MAGVPRRPCRSGRSRADAGDRRGRSNLALHDGTRTPDDLAALVQLGDEIVRRGPKWDAALGAVDPGERSMAVDLLGFEHQIVYSSLCAPLFDIDDHALRYAAYRAHNRAVAGFCSADPRLLSVAMCDLDDVGRGLAELDLALDLGLREVWLPARAPVGAGWVPDMLRRLDHAVQIWQRSEPRLAAFDRLPSEQAVAQLRFTPYPFEDVGRFGAESDPRLDVFSSDYPHAEGGRDPIGRFDRALAGAPPELCAGFYSGNACGWLGLA